MLFMIRYETSFDKFATKNVIESCNIIFLSGDFCLLIIDSNVMTDIRDPVARTEILFSN